MIRTTKLIGVALICSSLSCQSQAKSESESESSLYSIIDFLKISKNELSILIDKSDYTLKIIGRSIALKTYAVVFGSNPIDDKLKEGDRFTPEGTFHIKSKYPHKSWNKFIWLDYPNTSSLKKFEKAKRENKIPTNATPGGEIGIHGVPKGSEDLIDSKQNWTWGCIALKNKDLDEIYEIITTNTPIIIQK